MGYVTVHVIIVRATGEYVGIFTGKTIPFAKYEDPYYKINTQILPVRE